MPYFQFLRNLVLFVVLGFLSSCTIALPEFQTAESLEKGTHAVAAGGYSGRGFNASTGALVVHNYGVKEKMDWTSNVSVSRLNIDEANVRVALLSGPKWSTAGGTWAVAVPMGSIYTETFNDIDGGFTYLLTPTLYKSWKLEHSDLTSTFFARSEFAYNPYRGRWFSVVGGYSQKYETERLIHYLSLSGSTNGPVYGVYFGYGLSIRPKR